MRIALILPMPSPYHNPVFERVARKYGNDFFVLFMTKIEPNRSWKLDTPKFNHYFLKENYKSKTNSGGTVYVHNNYDVLQKLKQFNPDIVITRGFNPTALYGWLYAKLFQKKHIPKTDGWKVSEKNLSFAHRLIRKIVYGTSQAYIAASINSTKLYLSYGVDKNKIFKSHLCTDNRKFENNNTFEDREYDLMFSGRFVDRKLPLLFAEIASKIAQKIPNIKVLILGEGPLKEQFFHKLEENNINFHYAGFVQQDELPQYYAKSKLFLFPTKQDPWGVVANEAMASGTPVLTTPFAGIINDLLIDGKNGYILDIDSTLWSEKATKLLQNESLWIKFSNNAKESVAEFTFDNAAQGIIDACEYVYVKK